MRFSDRADATELLALQWTNYCWKRPAIFAIPRDPIGVGRVLATAIRQVHTIREIDLRRSEQVEDQEAINLLNQRHA